MFRPRTSFNSKKKKKKKAPRRPQPCDKWNPALNQVLKPPPGPEDKSPHFNNMQQPASYPGYRGSNDGVCFDCNTLPPPLPPNFDQFRNDLNHFCEKTGELLKKFDIQKNKYDAYQKEHEATIKDLWKRIKNFEDEKANLKRQNDILNRRYNNVGYSFQNYRDRFCRYRRNIFDQITYKSIDGSILRVEKFTPQSQDLCYEFAQGIWEDEYPYGDGLDDFQRLD